MFRFKTGQGRKGYEGNRTIVLNIAPRPGGAKDSIWIYAMCDSPSAVICEPTIEERWKQHEASVDAEERNRGKIVEVADSLERCDKPLHPYTKALFAASLPSHPDDEREEIVLSGEVPSALNPPPGCRFHPRCPFAMARCSGHEPKLVEVSPGTREPTISTSLSTAGQVYEIAIDTADRPR